MESKAIGCRQCGGEMNRYTKKESNIALQLVGVILFLGGLLLSLGAPGGWLIGAPVCVLSLFLGYKKIPGWRCKSCQYFFPIAK